MIDGSCAIVCVLKIKIDKRKNIHRTDEANVVYILLQRFSEVAD